MLNAIMLPAVLFTAQFSKPNDQTLQALTNLQKQYLWNGRLSTESTRHKMSPALIYSKVVNGGLGLISIPLAVKAQAMRRATAWILADGDVCKECWEHLARRTDPREYDGANISPTSKGTRRSNSIKRAASVPALGIRLVRERLPELENRKDSWQQRAAKTISEALIDAQMRTELDGKTTIVLATDPKPHEISFSEQTKNFWATYQWADNLLVVGADGRELKPSTYGFLQEGRLSGLEVERTGELEWRFKARLNGKRWT